jgi:cell division protein FtsA
VSREPYITVIDIGSNTTKLCVVKESSENPDKIQVLVLLERESAGIKKGIITNMAELTDTLIDLANQAESIIGLPIKKAVLGINTATINFTNSEGMAVISGVENEVTLADVDRAVQDSLNKAFSIQNNEILHLITKNFSVDNQVGIRNPIGMIANKIEVRTLIISCETGYIRNFNKAFNQASLDATSVVFTPLASSDFCLSVKQKKSGTILIDLGYSSTSYIVWENDEVVTSGVIPIGSDHITSDLAVGLQTNIEMAEEIKKNFLDFGVEPAVVSVEIFNPDTQNNEKFSTEEIHAFSEPRIEEIFMLIYRELRKVNKNSLPGGAVLIGGGAELRGVEQVAKNTLRIPVFKYNFDHNQVDFIPDYNGNLGFANVITLGYYSYHNQNETSTHKRKPKSPTATSDGDSGIWETIKKLLPFT